MTTNYDRLAFAVICDAITRAAQGDKDDQQWLLSQDGQDYCSFLDLPHNLIAAWGKGGFSNEAVQRRRPVNLLIHVLTDHYRDHNKRMAALNDGQWYYRTNWPPQTTSRLFEQTRQTKGD